MPFENHVIQTPSGPANATLCLPEGKGPWPIVVLLMDAGGPRVAMNEMGERIAKMGYLVAIPDLFHRGGDVWSLLPEGAPHDARSLGILFGDEKIRNEFMTRFYLPALDYDNLKADIGALLDVLEKRSDVTKKIGTTGYCMGGNASFRVATLFGDRIAATACFHAGGLVTPAPDSPHLRASAIKSKVYVAGAIEDQSFPDAAKKTLIEALEKAGVDFEVETYPAHHGFAVHDHHGAYDQAASERHYAALEKLFAATLK